MAPAHRPLDDLRADDERFPKDVSSVLANFREFIEHHELDWGDYWKWPELKLKPSSIMLGLVLHILVAFG